MTLIIAQLRGSHAEFSISKMWWLELCFTLSEGHCQWLSVSYRVLTDDTQPNYHDFSNFLRSSSEMRLIYDSLLGGKQWRATFSIPFPVCTGINQCCWTFLRSWSSPYFTPKNFIWFYLPAGALSDPPSTRGNSNTPILFWLLHYKALKVPGLDYSTPSMPVENGHSRTS